MAFDLVGRTTLQQSKKRSLLHLVKWNCEWKVDNEIHIIYAYLHNVSKIVYIS